MAGVHLAVKLVDAPPSPRQKRARPRIARGEGTLSLESRRMDTANREHEPFDIMDVERFRAGPSAMWLALLSVWCIALAFRISETSHPVLFWGPIAQSCSGGACG